MRYKITKYLVQFVNLQQLNISGCRSYLPDPLFLRELLHVTHLNIRGSEFETSDFLLALNLPKLPRLDCIWCGLSSEVLVTIVKQCPALGWLETWGNANVEARPVLDILDT